ncbi:anion permease [Lachnospiraceae bacterium ASD3451]|uniref:SLC13 family permease n=1 Tax=Diplocloster agilis TaxID=2850323 RepID=UPI001D7CE49A|nr:anion permease [Diplocloster agilis]MBU9744398.1 anion permease [Diplocloster agilis]
MIDVKSLNKKTVLVFCITLLIPLVILLIPAGGGFTGEIRMFFSITLLGICLFCNESFPKVASSFILMGLYVLSGLTDLSTVLKGFVESNVWIIVFSMLLVEIVNSRSTIITRIACYFVSICGGTYKGIVIGLYIGCAALKMLGFGSIPMICLLAIGLMTSMNLSVKETPKACAGIMFGAMCGSVTPLLWWYDPTTTGVFLNFTSAVSQINTNYLRFFVTCWPYLVTFLIFPFLLVKFMKPEMEIDGKEYFINKRKELGKLTVNDKKVSVILALMILYLIVASFQGWEMLWGFLVPCLVLYLPGIKMGEKAHFHNVNFEMAIFIVACMSIGTVASAVGGAAFLSEALVPLLSSVGKYGFHVIVYLIGILVNFVLTPFAAMSSLSAPLAQIAVDLGFSVETTALSLYGGLDQVFLPYEAMGWTIFFGFGWISLKNFVKCQALKIACYTITFLALVVPYWIIAGI